MVTLELETKTNEVFLQLRPICIKLLENPTGLPKTLDDLKMLATRTISRSSGPEMIAPLTDYIAFPLLNLLKKPLRSSAIELVLEILALLLDHADGYIHLRTFIEIFQSLVKIIQKDKDEFIRIKSIIALQKLLEINSLKEAVSSSQQILSEDIYRQEKYIPIFMSPVVILLDIAKDKTDLNLRERALLVIRTLVERISNSNVLFRILPGLTSSLIKIVHEECNKNSSIVVSSLDLLSLFLELVFSGRIDDSKEYENTMQKLESAIKILLAMRMNDDPKVRHAFALFSRKLIRSCRENLEKLIPFLIDTFVLFLTDPFDHVRNGCFTFINDLQDSLAGDYDLKFILKESFQLVLSEMTRVMKAVDERKKLEFLRRANGYIILLQDSIRIPIAACLPNISIDLFKMIEFDYDDVKVIEDRYSKGDAQISANQLLVQRSSFRENIHFKYIKDNDVIDAIKLFCRLLGFFGDSNIILDNLCGYISDLKFKYLPECMWMINELIGCLGGNDIERFIGRRLLDDLFIPHKEEVSVSAQTVETHYRSLLDQRLVTSIDMVDDSRNRTEGQVGFFNRNVLIVCLGMLGFRNIAKIMGKEYYPLLQEDLFLILERAGDENVKIRDAAFYSLQEISRHFEYKSEALLISANFDYIVNCISLRFRDLLRYPTVPQVLSASVWIAKEAVIPFIDDVIDDVIEALDKYHLDHEYLTLLLCRALHSFISVCASESCESETHLHDKSKNDESVSCELRLLKQHVDLDIQRKKEDEKLGENANIEEIKNFYESKLENQNQDEEDDMRRKLSPNQQLIFKILEKILYFASAESPKLRQIALNVIKMAAPKLKNKPLVLNPYIHRIWPILVHRVTDTYRFVQEEALDLLCTLASSSHEFLTRRVVTDLWPSLDQICTRLLKSEDYLRHGQRYQKSSHFKFHKSFLRTVNVILREVPLKTEDIQKVTESVWPFMNRKRFPVEVCDLATETFQEAVNREADLAWLISKIALQEDIDTLRIPRYFYEHEYGNPSDFALSFSKIVFA